MKVAGSVPPSELDVIPTARVDRHKSVRLAGAAPYPPWVTVAQLAATPRLAGPVTSHALLCANCRNFTAATINPPTVINDVRMNNFVA